jgi:hypothetical protein
VARLAGRDLHPAPGPGAGRPPAGTRMRPTACECEGCRPGPAADSLLSADERHYLLLARLRQVEAERSRLLAMLSPPPTMRPGGVGRAEDPPPSRVCRDDTRRRRPAGHSLLMEAQRDTGYSRCRRPGGPRGAACPPPPGYLPESVRGGGPGRGGNSSWPRRST